MSKSFKDELLSVSRGLQQKQNSIVNLIILCFFLVLSQNYEAEELHLELIYDFSTISNSSHNNTASRGLMTFSYENHFDFGSGELMPFISYSLLRGSNGSDLAMDIQGFSNIDEQPFSKWQEVGFEWSNKDTYLRIGQLDANANFSAIDRAGDFINASFGLTPTAHPLPTYPETEPGFYVQHRFSKMFQTGLGYYLPDEVGEDIGRSTPLLLLDNCWYCDDHFRFVTGYWQLKFKNAKTVNGQFSFLEGELTEKINGFILYSRTDDSHPDQIDKHIKLGLNYNEPFSFKNHKMGIGVSKIFGVVEEKAVEFFYQIPVLNQLDLKFDIQYINDSTAQNDTLVYSLRSIWHIL